MENVSYFQVVVHTIGGLGLFMFGMRTMSQGLQHAAGNRLRKILEAVSANRVLACFSGAVVTAAIQSSSATTVMLVGFVNAGLMSLNQAVGVAIGANVGTTVTAQMIAFKVTDAALPAIALGAFMKVFSKNRQVNHIGEVILGFGLLFYGMVIMKTGVAPLKNAQIFIDFFTRFDPSEWHGLLLCVLVGTIVTMMLQSSSATIGLTMTLASQGLLTFPASVALILGDNIGTTITAELASIGTNVNAHRTARAHTMLNVIGVSYTILLFPFFVQFITWLTSTTLGLGPPDTLVGQEKPFIARYIANAHTMFNVINAILFLLILPTLVNVATKLTFTSGKKKETDLAKPAYLDKNFMGVVPVALRQARQEVVRMADIADVMMKDIFEALRIRQIKKLQDWQPQEEALDKLQREITNYLVAVSQSDITLEESKEISSLMRMVNNVERVGDSLENIAELVEEMLENDIQLSPEGLRDYQEISQEVINFFEYIHGGLRGKDGITIDQAKSYEHNIDIMREEMRSNHLTRLRSGVCTLDPGLMFTDILNHLEKVGDYTYNIAQAVLGLK